ncbi:FAD-binding protein [Telmatocola sphagniphila]|uniref:FAD-binding protein n=1 Tax=Telmatocola sphagniphila TaxID=1123043 RepID=A0A8E6BAF0_9BACT|nr:FAD-binding and (Fe-S)-binding domain-containing protein [Telmatocola sphagniphila]QVL34224.1 FAD-binding protein [Telmatocola sphagniphila]
MDRFADLQKHLQKHTQAEIRFDSTTRHLYSTDASIYQVPPLGVVIPRTAEDLQSTLQIALEQKIPIIPRGGGTSLSGQSIGAGLIIDCSKYLQRIQFGELDSQGRPTEMVVQPGVVLDDLNRAAGKYQMQFGPEVATANRATLGGMIGNNSAGSRSIVYGRTIDHVLGLKMMFADGTFQQIGKLPAVAERNKNFQKILTGHETAIRAVFPKIQRRVSGYNLVDCLPDNSLLPLLVGSEGTLGFTLEARLRLIPKPKQRGLIVPQFSSMRAALDALSLCLESKPSAVELMDALLIQLAKKQRGLADSFQVVTGDPAALLIVELVGDDGAEVADRSEKLEQRLRSVPGLTDVASVLQNEEREKLWNARRSAVPLLYSIPGKRKPITFVEDTAVSPEVLPQFADDFREILKRHGTDGAFYGHASVGCLHIRPLLDIQRNEDLNRMTAIMEDITSLVRSYKGSLSGEHGDGLVRSSWNRKMFGDEVYGAFQQVKDLFDPGNLFNPGKIVNGPPMTENLRYAKAEKIELITVKTQFDYSKQEGFFNSVELCNGSGVCRKTQNGTMCPSYRATRDEKDTPRGRANALRHVMVDQQPISERWVHEVMDLCLSCKACKTECPSNVDVAKMKAEHQAAYYAIHSRPRSHYAARYVDTLNKLGSLLPSLSNWLGSFSFTRRIAGFHADRPLPRFARRSFFSWFRRRKTPLKPKNGKSIVLFADCLTSYTEPGIGRSTVQILELLGYTVELSSVKCCGRAKISKGFLAEAKAAVRAGAQALATQAATAEAIIGWEPSCVVALQDEWTELLVSPETKAIAAKTWLIDDWLAVHLKELLPHWPAAAEKKSVVLHGHCHQKAMLGTAGPVQVLKAIPGCEVKLLDTGCCGMAGMFGYEKEHYELSKQIAELSVLPQLRDNPQATVIADGTSCRHQISDLSQRPSMHLVEWVASNLNLDSK